VRQRNDRQSSSALVGEKKSFDDRRRNPTDIHEAQILTVRLEAGSLEAKAEYIPPFLLTSLHTLLIATHLAKTLGLSQLRQAKLPNGKALRPPKGAAFYRHAHFMKAKQKA
jgi:hypothetical protein